MGAFIRHQRELANMSLRQLSQATQVSNAYLSQIERGLHDPTLRVLIQIGAALQLSIEDMLREGVHQSGEADPGGPGGLGGVEAAVRADARLGAAEKQALIAVYRSFLKPHQEVVSVADALGHDL